MSELSLHHDLIDEAATRRSREAHRFAREKAVRRAMSTTEARPGGLGVRVRLIELMARVMGVAGEIATKTPPPRQQTPAHRPHH